jgi:hypothetical protein
MHYLVQVIYANKKGNQKWHQKEGVSEFQIKSNDNLT